MQNGTEQRKPAIHKKKAIKLLGQSRSVLKSDMTVAAASTIEKPESIPSMKSVVPSKKAQRFDQVIISIAVGYAMKARPTELVLDLAILFSASRKPTIDHTAKPAVILTALFEIQIIKLSIMIGFLTSL